jgi:hypothetical protein
MARWSDEAMANETYDQNQIRMIRDARRAQERADADFARTQRQGTVDSGQWKVDTHYQPANAQNPAPLPLQVCQQCYDLGVSAGRERERIRRWNDRIFCLVLGAFLGFVIAAMLTAIFWAKH